MENDKPSKENKGTPTKLVKNFIRKSHYLLRHKADGAIGPKYVFITPRVPQIKL